MGADESTSAAPWLASCLPVANMPKFRLSRIAILLSVLLTALTLLACSALKIVTDIMDTRSEHLAHEAMTTRDPHRMAWLDERIETWSQTADYIGWGVAALVLAATLVAIIGSYKYVYRPFVSLTSSMERFTAGDRYARAGTSQAIELAKAADNFNQMADIITGQHERMLDFLGGAARELKDPVHLMQVALEEFAPNRRLPNEPLMRQRLAIFSRELGRLDRMVDNYVDASNVEWRRLDLQQGREDLRVLAQHVTKMYERFSDVHRITLSVPEQPVWIFAHADRLQQVIHALLTNAIAFSPRGGVVETVLTVEGQEAVLSVTDHGIGISEQDLPTVFEPFQKVSGAHQNAPGNAVALSVAQRIVQAHHGQIAVTSKLGQGSTFRVRMPLAGEPNAKEAASARPPAQDGQSARSEPSTPQQSAHA
jgi:signal transduction histidine kinase